MRTDFTPWVAALLLMLPLPAAAQAPGDAVIVRQSEVPDFEPLPAGQATLAGRAIDREAKTPLVGARVIVRLLGQRVGEFGMASTPYGRVLSTDANGEFAVPQLAYGTYLVEVSMAGYADAAAFLFGPARRTLQVTDARPLATAAFALSRLGTIAGIVVDENGQPQADQAVQLYRRPLSETPLQMPILTAAITDSQGRYRFTHVPPSDYVIGIDLKATTMPVPVLEAYRRGLPTTEGQRIAARLEQSNAPVPRPMNPALTLTLGGFRLSIEDGARRQRAVELSPDGRIMAIASTYAPGVTSFAEARVYTLTAGASMTGVTITIRRQATVRVSGTLSGPEGATGLVGLRLVHSGADHINSPVVGDAAVTVTDAEGRFTFLAVPPGRYTIEGTVFVPTSGGAATMPVGRPALERWAKLPIEVSTQDVDGLSLSLSPPLVVSGRAVFVTKGNDSAPRPVQAGIRILLSPRTGQEATFPVTVTAADGTFSLGPVFPSRYQLSADVGRPWRVLSIVVGGRDVTNAVIDVDRPLTDVVITFTVEGR